MVIYGLCMAILIGLWFNEAARLKTNPSKYIDENPSSIPSESKRIVDGYLACQLTYDELPIHTIKLWSGTVNQGNLLASHSMDKFVFDKKADSCELTGYFHSLTLLSQRPWAQTASSTPQRSVLPLPDCLQLHRRSPGGSLQAFGLQHQAGVHPRTGARICLWNWCKYKKGIARGSPWPFKLTMKREDELNTLDTITVYSPLACCTFGGCTVINSCVWGF